MPRIKYKDHRFSEARLAIIDQANEIISEYDSQGYSLTLRQLYYQFVSRDLIENKQSEYDKLGDIISKARLAGLVDWEAIEDRTRNLQSLAHWDSPQEILDAIVPSYRIDKWAGQTYRPEVWIEKDALVGVIENVCNRHDVAYFSCRGYNSQSEMWRGGQRYCEMILEGQVPFIIHLGDHDPSGIDMTRDISDRMKMFIGAEFHVKRIALNWDQVEEFNPPPNPAKFTDSRAAKYVEAFGASSWELDALEPSYIERIVDEAIMEVRDHDAWEVYVRRENKERKKLAKLSIK